MIFLSFLVFLVSFNLYCYYHPRTKYEGRYCFHRCLSVCQHFGGVQVQVGGWGYLIQLTEGGGIPSQVWTNGTPSQVQVEGYPIQLIGGTPSQVWIGGVPHPRPEWGYPPPSRTGCGTPLPHLDLGWGTPSRPPVRR